MAKDKRYFWFKLKEDFFSSPKIKRAYMLAGEKRYMVSTIYQKLILKALNTCGTVTNDNSEICDSFEEYISLLIDEDLETTEYVLTILKKCKLAEDTEQGLYLPDISEDCVDSETDSAQRMRNMRARNSSKMPQNEPIVTDSTISDGLLSHCYTDIDTDTETEKNINTELQTEHIREGVSRSFSLLSFEMDPERLDHLNRIKEVLDGSENFTAEELYISAVRKYGDSDVQNWEALATSWKKSNKAINIELPVIIDCGEVTTVPFKKLGRFYEYAEKYIQTKVCNEMGYDGICCIAFEGEYGEIWHQFGIETDSGQILHIDFPVVDINVPIKDYEYSEDEECVYYTDIHSGTYRVDLNVSAR